jgi:hypothetical protein
MTIKIVVWFEKSLAAPQAKKSRPFEEPATPYRSQLPASGYRIFLP